MKQKRIRQTPRRTPLGRMPTRDAALAGGDVHEAIDTPAGAPRVLHLDATIGVHANSQHTVVEVGAASGRDDTTSVLLEGSLVSLNGHGDWGVHDGAGQAASRMA